MQKISEPVDPDRISAIGYCFGGATVQQLAYAGANLRGVVSFHDSPLLPGEGETAKVRAKILIFHGAADPFTAPDQLQKYLSEMGASGLDWHFIAYGGARHSFTNPGADAKGMEALAYDRTADIPYPGFCAAQRASGNSHLEFARQLHSMERFVKLHPDTEGILLPELAKCGAGTGANASDAQPHCGAGGQGQLLPDLVDVLFL